MDRPIPLRPDRHALALSERRSFTHAITAMALGDTHREAATILKQSWPDDRAADLYLRAAVNPTSTANVPTLTAATVMPSLAPQSAATRLFAKALPIDLSGVSIVRIPNVPTRPIPIFIGEGQSAPVVSLLVGGTPVGPVRKILILAAVSGELENAGAETASAVIGKVLADAASKSLDVVVFGKDAATATQPAGLLHGISALTAATGGGLTAMVSDLSKLAGALSDAGISPENMVFVCNPAEAVKIRLLASSAFNSLILGSPAIPEQTVIGVAANAVGSAYNGSPEIETSKDTTLHMEDSVPSPLGTPGTPNTVAAPTRSLFQSDLIGIKVRVQAAWAALPGAVAYVEGVSW